MKMYKNFIFEDPIENVGSFEEARVIVHSRLTKLKEHLKFQLSAEESLFLELCNSHELRRKMMMNLYARYYSPCKVSDTVYIPKGETDMNDVMLDFSEGYNKFISNMDNEFIRLSIRRLRAAAMLNNIFSIEYPYSRIMYLTYFLGMDSDAIAEELYISRATYFRLKAIAINILTSFYYHKPDGGGDKPFKICLPAD